MLHSAALISLLLGCASVPAPWVPVQGEDLLYGGGGFGGILQIDVDSYGDDVGEVRETMHVVRFSDEGEEVHETMHMVRFSDAAEWFGFVGTGEEAPDASEAEEAEAPMVWRAGGYDWAERCLHMLTRTDGAKRGEGDGARHAAHRVWRGELAANLAFLACLVLIIACTCCGLRPGRRRVLAPIVAPVELTVGKDEGTEKSGDQAPNPLPHSSTPRHQSYEA